jgi:hypothetical protein
MNSIRRMFIFDVSLRCLTHPLTWLAIALLVINDHLLKVLMPSWLTGKLSDFAGLFFFPFVLAALLSLPLDRLRVSSRRAGGCAIAITGVCFTLIKTVPAINLLAGDAFSQIIGYRTAFVLDPTDLLALSMLLPAWWLWKQPAAHARRRAGWGALAIGAAASIASQPPTPEFGIVGLELTNAGAPKTIASAVSSTYDSQDGGLTWTSANRPDVDHQAYQALANRVEARTSWTMSDPSDSQIVYRLTPGQGIERSTDGGNSWISELSLQPLTEAQQKYYQRYTQGDPHIVQGPFESAADPYTGNVIASMGVEGVLVRTPDGQWQWSKVGAYGHVNPASMDTLSILWTPEISMELWLGVILAGLVLGVGAWAWGCRFRSLKAALILGFAGMVCASLAGSARTHIAGGIDGMQLWMLGALSIASLAALVAGYRGLTYPMERRARSIGIAFASMLLFWLPFVLWTQNIIPYWQEAMLIAVVVACAMIALQYGSLRRLARKQAAALNS